jgi:hypothetical protein
MPLLSLLSTYSWQLCFSVGNFGNKCRKYNDSNFIKNKEVPIQHGDHRHVVVGREKGGDCKIEKYWWNLTA